GTANSFTASSGSGSYGTYTMSAGGAWSYSLDNANAAVQALRTAGNTLSDSFTVTAADGTSQLVSITVQGANDAPVGVADTGAVVEAGGVANATPGTNPSGNVLTNDTDVDAGDTKTVSAITGGTVGSAKAGTYGSVTLNANGTFTYTVDNSNSSVQALRT